MAKLNAVVPIPVEMDQEPIPAEHNSKSYLLSILRPLSSVQKYSAYTFGVFLGIHACSVIIVPSLPAPVTLKSEVFEMARAVYHQIPFFEPICVFGAATVHVVSGIIMRAIRGQLARKRAKKRNHKRSESEEIITDDSNKDIGLGGLAGILGMGYRKSSVSRWLGMTPLAFSGFMLIPLVLYHVAKFRLVPASVDGDSSLITLDFISYYLNVSQWGKWGNFLNTTLLMLLVYAGVYHLVSGWMYYNRKFSLWWKKIGYGIVSTLTIMGAVAIYGYKNKFGGLVNAGGFMAKSFTKYAHAAMW